MNYAFVLFSGVANRNEFTSDYSLLAIDNFYMPIWRKKTCLFFCQVWFVLVMIHVTHVYSEYTLLML